MAVRYELAPPPPDDIRAHLSAYDTLAQTLLYNRGITNSDDAAAFVTPDYDTHRHDPFLLPDMERAVTRILAAHTSGEPIVVYSDYDCDGIPGGVLLHDFFSAIGNTNFKNYIPHRHEEGYGLNVAAVEKLAQEGARLIITVDCGITDVVAVARAQELGVDVIVTDHHEPGHELPSAYAVINPKRTDNQYPFPNLCGTGVAFKLVEALIARGNFDIPAGREKWWLDVVGLATIADMVPLRGENRVLAHYGLTVMRKTRRPGLQHLFRGMRMQSRFITEDDIGFMIAPRINAASRMDSPEDAFLMLTTTDEGKAGSYAKHLEHINNERKGVVAAMIKDIKKRLAHAAEMHDVLVVGHPSWRPALAGLAANTLAEEYRRPVFVWGRDGRDVIKGSCRSDGALSVVTLMHETKDVFIEYGGHHMSGGFSVRNEQIHILESRLNDAYRAVASARETTSSHETVYLDADLALDNVSESTWKVIDTLAPFGIGNEKPLFRFRGVVPSKVEMFGKGKEHLRIVFKRERGTLEAIGFFANPESYSTPLVPGTPIDLIAHIEKSYFMNRATVRLRVVDVM